MNIARQQLVISPVPVGPQPGPYRLTTAANNKPGFVLGGKYQDAEDAWKLDTVAIPPGRYQDVRDDISKYAPITVTRVAMKYASHQYVGIIDSGNTPYFFSLNSRGMMIRRAPNTDETWSAFDQFMDAERSVALHERRRDADHEQEMVFDKISDPQLVLMKGLKKPVKTPGSRGGTFYFDKHGHVRYGHPSVPKAKHDRIDDRNAHVKISSTHKLEADDDLGHHFRKKIKSAKPKTMHDVRRIVRAELKAITDGKSLDENTINVLKHLHETEALHLAHPEVKVETERFFKTRRALAKPTLPKSFNAIGTQLTVNGKGIRLSADAEHACYAYTKRFLVNEGVVKGQAEFLRGFEKSLQSMGVPAGKYDFAKFVKRVKSDMANVQEKPEKDKREVTAKTHPHMFIRQDGEDVRLADVRTPAGNFYTGKGKRGWWARSLREEDLTMNVSNGAAPKGWKGKVIDDPSKDYYLTWRHPDTDEIGYVYPSRARAYQKKFEEAQALGKHIESMRPQFVRDWSEGSHTETRMTALCAYLMDKEHFRVGDETHAEDTGTFGVASLRAEHVKVHGTQVEFNFPGKKDEPWRRLVDFSQMPDALKFIKECLRGKSKGDKFWSHGAVSITSKDVNEYLNKFSTDGVKFTAKMFRTFHANKYMHAMLEKLKSAEKVFGLTAVDVKKLYKGFSTKDKAGQRLLATKHNGTSLREWLGLEENKGSKGNKKTTIGVLPTIATRLGHTVSSCRNSYIDPVMVTRFAADHGWDERTQQEKKQRDDLPVYEKPVKQAKKPLPKAKPKAAAKEEPPSRMPPEPKAKVEQFVLDGAYVRKQERAERKEAGAKLPRMRAERPRKGER